MSRSAGSVEDVEQKLSSEPLLAKARRDARQVELFGYRIVSDASEQSEERKRAANDILRLAKGVRKLLDLWEG